MGRAGMAVFPSVPPWHLVPISKDPSMEIDPAPQTEHQTLCWPQKSGVRVLVVNDYADNVESMALLLRLYGHEVETALGGPAALRAAWTNPPDVVLLDISMPGMNGYEVARQLRRMFQDRVVIIALTAHGFEEDKRRCLEAGFDRHFVKPADPLKVEKLIRNLVHSL
jgi:CheY-like chemotaxis protein